MRYIITGKGRTGTHFVADLLGSCLPGSWEEVNTQEEMLISETQDVIFHTNDSTTLVPNHLYQILYETSTVIYCYRKNIMAMCVSMSVALKTGEWNFYSNDPVEPFDVDVDEFIFDVEEYYWFHSYSTERLQQIFPPDRLFIVCYEDVLTAQNPRQFICEKIGLEFRPLETIVGPEDDGVVSRGKNPRDYRKIIKNYAELEKIYNEYIQKHPPPWVSQ